MDIEFWAIQKHHLDVGSQRKQWFGKRIVFYGDKVDGSSGVLSIVNFNLEPKVVFNHPSRRVIGVQIKWGDGNLTIFNIYAPNSTKLCLKTWKDLIKLDFEGDWCIIGDFSMVKAKANSQEASRSCLSQKRVSGKPW